MNERKLAIVTTRLPPATCGVGAYSALLREHWPGDRSQVEFLVTEEATGAAVRDGDKVTAFHGSGARLAQELDRIGAADVLLQYAGRAYQRFGFPRWMPRAFETWKRKFPEGCLMIVVHELPAAGFPITSRHFWLGKLGQRVLRDLAAVADVLVTNTEHHVAQLHRISGRADIHILPVSSNIDVAPDASPEPRALTEFVLFGLPFGRWQTLQKFDADVRRWHASGRLTTLHIIGPGGDEFSRQADELIQSWPLSITLQRHGTLPSSQVSRLLRRARFALTNVTSSTWSKSGSFMACAAHECAVVISNESSRGAPLSFAVRADELETIADAEVASRSSALAQWYREHADWPVIATRMAELLEEKEAIHAG